MFLSAIAFEIPFIYRWQENHSVVDGAAQETSNYDCRVRWLLSNISNFPKDILFLFHLLLVCKSFREKRSQPSTNGNGPASKRGRGGMQNQLVNRAFEGLSRGGRGSGRGRGRGGRGRGRGWGGYRWDKLGGHSTWHKRMGFLLPLESKHRDWCLFVVCFPGVGSYVCNKVQLILEARNCKMVCRNWGCLRMWATYVQHCCPFYIHRCSLPPWLSPILAV